MRKHLFSFGFSMLCAAPALAEQTFGLVIGIDDYAYVPDLHGAVNDATDIADALGSLGAEVTLLTNSDATRKAILGAWEHILQTAKEGDRLIVTYAGHGSNEPEHTPGNEADGRDENFLLAGFAPRGEAAAQRIRDDEIADLLARSAELDVIFVADACHAGTVTRNLNPVLGYRYVTPETVAGDPLPPPPPPPSGGETSDVALFLAAVNETEKVPEVLIDATPRGALSYAFADGLRGAADLNGDARITKGELETYVRRTVRQLSDGAQLPQSEPSGHENRALFALNRAMVETVGALEETVSAAEASSVQIGVETSFRELPPLQVAGNGWVGIQGTRLGDLGALRLDGSTVLSGVGDRVAVARDRATLQAVVDKHRLVTALLALAQPPLGIRFDQGDRTYEAGQDLAIRVEGRRTPNLTLFNLDAAGRMSLLYPDPAFGDPGTSAPHDQINLPVRVTAPFGADHVIAVEARGAPEPLRQALAALNGTQNAEAIWDLIRHTDGHIAIFPFFTEEATL